MTVRVLGTVAVAHEGERKRIAPSGRTLLAILVAAGPDGLTDEQIAHEIWGDELSDGWNQNLRRQLSRLRKAFDLDQVRSGGRRYELSLSTDEVDAWQLLAFADLDLNAIEDDRLQSLLADTPFPEPPDSRLVEVAVADIEAARIELLERLSETHPQRLKPTLLTATAAMARTSWNEPLIDAVVAAHLAAGSRPSAVDLIEDAIARFTTDLGVSPTALVQRHASLAGDATATDPASPEPHQTLPTSPPRWIGPRPDPRDLPSVDRPTLLAAASEALDDRPIVLTGESGSGKTRLVQLLAARRHDAGHHVVWAVAPRNSTSAFGTLLAVLPEWVDDLPIDGSTEAIAETRQATAFVRRLKHACPDHPITIVVDDAHWLDSQSLRIVDFVARSADQRLAVVIVGRHDDDSTTWERTVDGFERAGAATIQVGPFGHDELVSLIATIHPAATSRQRNDLANHLLDIRGDLPLVANELIASADPETLALPAFERTAPRWTDAVWTDAVSATTRDLACAAALTGVTWTFGEVLDLTGVDADALIDATNELEDAGLVISEARPDQFSFRHALIHDAFAAHVEPSERFKIHRRAADIAAASGRVHDRARHLRAAGPIADPAIVSSALIESANAHLERGAWLEAVTALSGADQIGGALDATTLAVYAYAIERSGGVPTAMRQRAFEAAHRDNDAETMLKVALHGAETGELLETSGTRLHILDRVPRDRLGVEDQRRLDLARCRELGVVPDHASARELYDRLTINGPDVEAWLAIWTSLVGSPPSTWPTNTPDADEATDELTRVRMRNILCDGYLVLGRRDDFDRELERFAAEPAAHEHPNRRWFLLLLQAVQAQVDGDFTRASQLADEGFVVGSEAGLSGAFPARSAQLFAHHWVHGTHGDLVPLLDMSPPDIRESHLATVAYGVALLEHPERGDDARTIIDAVFAELNTLPHAAQTPIAALLASRADLLSSDDRLRVRELLDPHRGAAVLLGSGIAHLGPATRSIAKLVDSGSDRNGLLVAAIAEADAWRLPLWSVLCRLDLHAETGATNLLTEAQAMANGTDLEGLLP